MIEMTTFHAPARSAEKLRNEASIQAFFRFFSMKNTLFSTFLPIFHYISTILHRGDRREPAKGTFYLLSALILC